jgi:hypothetical protein
VLNNRILAVARNSASSPTISVTSQEIFTRKQRKFCRHWDFTKLCRAYEANFPDRSKILRKT